MTIFSFSTLIELVEVISKLNKEQRQIIQRNKILDQKRKLKISIEPGMRIKYND